MNFRTTLYLAVCLVVVLAIVWFSGTETPQTGGPVQPPTELLAETSLIPDDFGRVVKLACQAHDQQEAWRFERPSDPREAALKSWQMLAPFEVAASEYKVDNIVRKLTSLKYKVRYAAGEGLTAQGAGLEPPQAVVTLENKEGRSIGVEIGREISDSETYVRLAGAADIYVVSPGLDKLLGDKAVEYRDQNVFDIQADQVKRLEITHRPEQGEPETYILVRSETGWTFESPVKAKAVKENIDRIANQLASLRMSSWIEGEPDDLKLFGLEAPAITVQATVEEQPEPSPAPDEDDEDAAEQDDAEAEEEPAEPEPVIRLITLHLSRRSPIGEDNKVYSRREGDPAVGVVIKGVADRMTPDMTEWREMRLTTVPVTEADRIELATPLGQGIFLLQQGQWVQDSGEALDGETVAGLLKQLSELKAVNFVPLEGAPAEYGFDAPQAEIRLNVPGEPEPERITVGRHTDLQTRRLVFVRRNDSESIAKVRLADVHKLIRSPVEYQDRTILAIAEDQITRLEITRPDELSGGRFTFALARQEGEFRLVEPVVADAAADEVRKLTETLSKLQAVKVLPDPQPSRFGLDDPAFVCRITRQPPTITRYVQVEAEETPPEEQEPDSAERAGHEQADQADAAKDEPAEPKLRSEQYTPPAEEYTLRLNPHGDSVLAMREDGPAIYEVARTVMNLLKAEFHDRAIFAFEESQVVSVSVVEPGGAGHGFRRVDEGWEYAVEPDLPLDPKKITSLLLRIKDLKTHRYVAFGSEDLAAYGLDTPGRTVRVTLEDGSEQGLIVSERVCDQDRQKRRYAARTGSDDVFLLADSEIERFRIDLAEFEAAP